MKKAISVLLCALLISGALLMGACGSKTGKTDPTTAPDASVGSEAQPTEAPTEAPTETPTEAPTEALTEAPAETVSAVPSSKEEIVAFYAKAVNDVKENGAAGYGKKEFNAMKQFKATGNSTADEAIGKAISSFTKDENHTQLQNYAKGSDEAKNNMLGWALSDPAKVSSAALAENGGNYEISIVMAGEDTPRRGARHLAEIGSVLVWEDFEKDLKNVSFIRGYDDAHVNYTSYTINAVISPEGKLRSVKHHADYTLSFGSVKLPFIGSMNDLSIGLENTVIFSDFTY